MSDSVASNQSAVPNEISTFRRVMGSFATGVAVITTAHAGELHGMTVNSVTSVSLDPLIALVCIVKGSRTGQAILDSGRFAVNFLAEGQQDISARFVSKELKRFADGGYREDEWGVPLIDGGLAHLVCEVHATHEIGDHLVVYGRVLRCAATERRPLLFWRGQYHSVHATSGSA